MPFQNDIADYFLYPKETGYDVQKTLVYSILLVISAYVVFKILKRIGVKTDERLAISITPYVIFGAILRVLQDIGTVNSYLFVTPGIYFFVFATAFSIILISLALDRKYNIPFYKLSFLLGTLTIPFVLSYISPTNFNGGVMVIAFFLPWALVSAIVPWKVENKLITLLHLFDATTTAVSMQFFGYYEQHVLPTLFINLFGPFSFVFIKLLVIASVLVFIDKAAESDKTIEKDFVYYIKLIIGLLGAATGTRDFVTLVAGV